jgi:hypothetical protein
MDIGWCPDCGIRLTIVLSEGGDRLTKKKLKVMHDVKTKSAQEVTAKPEADKITEPKNDVHLEKMIDILGKLGGSATSPEIVRELGWEPEKGRQRVRSLMDKLHAEHRIHRTREGKVYRFKLAEQPKAEPKVEVAAA